MQTLQVDLAEHQYQRLANTAEARGASMTDLVIEAVEAFLSAESLHNRYARLIHKQALWDRNPKALDAMRLDLIYHSEALEGSPLTKSQVQSAIKEQPAQ
ncbi:MAG: hypothetical protein JXA21_23885 [Anaerolineae bacterium]|nr:hypothetical protein [Anaerolineae bacterium]